MPRYMLDTDTCRLRMTTLPYNFRKISISLIRVDRRRVGDDNIRAR